MAHAKYVSEEHGCSAEAWREWITGEVRRIENVFVTSPMHLISAYRIEKKYAAEYRGQELLELLQNADDASTGDSTANRVVVVLDEEGLCFANSGKPFSRKGIQSLMVSDNSPKRYGEARFIGNKGLGFRSILSWTECPFIFSGELAVGFDSKRARSWLEKLSARSPEIRERVQEVTHKSLKPPSRHSRFQPCWMTPTTVPKLGLTLTTSRRYGRLRGD